MSARASWAGWSPRAASPRCFSLGTRQTRRGRLILTGPFILALGNSFRVDLRRRGVKTVVLSVCLVFVGQAIYLSDELRDWPRSYMVIPLLLWATFRFGPSGPMLSATLVALVAAFATMRGFGAFPAATPTQSLLLLQVFLALISVTTLSITAGIAEVGHLRHALAGEVLARNDEIRRLGHERDVFARLVAHDFRGRCSRSATRDARRRRRPSTAALALARLPRFSASWTRPAALWLGK